MLRDQGIDRPASDARIRVELELKKAVAAGCTIDKPWPPPYGMALNRVEHYPQRHKERCVQEAGTSVQYLIDGNGLRFVL